MHECRYAYLMPLVLEQQIIPSPAEHDLCEITVPVFFDAESTFAFKQDNLFAKMVRRNCPSIKLLCIQYNLDFNAYIRKA